MSVLAVIPARYKSSRYPGKPLVEIHGVPMVIRVARIAAEAFGIDNVAVATEDERIASVVESHGYTAIMTSDRCLTGTDRLAEVATKRPADVYINVQGDEPMLDPRNLRLVYEKKLEHMGEVVNAMCKLTPDEDPHNVNLPKVAAGLDGRLVYMSRLAIPGFKSEDQRPKVYWKQVCIYAFTADELAAYAALGHKGLVEVHEDIEILRFVELGYSVRMVEVDGGSLAVDVPEDVELVEAAMTAQGLV